MSNFVTIHLADGTTTEVPTTNLENFKRIHFNRIKFIDEGLDAVPDLGEPIGVEDVETTTAEPVGAFNKTSLRTKKVEELRVMAEGLGIDITGMKKTALIDAILDKDK